MNVALLTASGTGTRMHNNVPKQFLCVRDTPILLYTIQSFERHPDIDAMIVVCLEGWEAVLQAYIRQAGVKKVRWIVRGGATGQQSIRAGLAELERYCAPEDLVLIHDGNRPLVPQSVITDALVTCGRYGSAVAHIPCTEVLFRKEGDPDAPSSGLMEDRDSLLRSQTPHVFPLGRLLWAYREADRRGLPEQAASCCLFTLLGETIHFSTGSELNFKITTQADLEILRALLEARHREGLRD